jgi:carbamoyl-phosphate synthase small subunit
MKAIISSLDTDPSRLVAKAKKSFGLAGRDQVSEVTPSRERRWGGHPPGPDVPVPTRLVMVDLGATRSLLNALFHYGYEVVSVPAGTSGDEVLALEPAGIILSSGPGDPSALHHLVGQVQKLLGKKPIFGIGLGNLVLGRALGGSTYQMRVGHHGANQPVRNVFSGKAEITLQHHSFALDAGSLHADAVKVTHVNLNDETIEGIKSPQYSAFSVQYSPRIGPAEPVDSTWCDFQKAL